MDQNFYFQIQDKPLQNRSTLLRFVATYTYLYKNEFLLFNQ